MPRRRRYGFGIEPSVGGFDPKLRGCDLVRLRVSDLAAGGSLRQRATVIQQKTGRPVPFEITDSTRDALAGWLAIRGRRDDDWLFPSRSRPGDHISARQYARWWSNGSG